MNDGRASQSCRLRLNGQQCAVDLPLGDCRQLAQSTRSRNSRSRTRCRGPVTRGVPWPAGIGGSNRIAEAVARRPDQNVQSTFWKNAATASFISVWKRLRSNPCASRQRKGAKQSTRHKEGEVPSTWNFVNLRASAQRRSHWPGVRRCRDILVGVSGPELHRYAHARQPVRHKSEA